MPKGDASRIMPTEPEWAAVSSSASLGSAGNEAPLG